MRRAVILLAFPIALLTACSSSAGTSSAKAETTPDPSVQYEADYLSMLDSDTITMSDDELLDVGYAICKVLENGQIGEGDVIQYAMDQYGVDSDALVAAVFVNRLCPDWERA